MSVKPNNQPNVMLMTGSEGIQISAPSYCGVVRHIPSSFHSADLRNFFSDFVEKAKFVCFHFKHRPELAKDERTGDNKTVKSGTLCCVFQVMDENSLTKFVKKYNDTNWVDSHGNYLKSRCSIHKIRASKPCHGVKRNIANSDLGTQLGYATRRENDHIKRHAVTEEFSMSDLSSLSEFRPPTHIMPRGNVGTTIKEFMKLINECKLPPRIIKKLGLKFPKTGSNRRYGNVPFQYTNTADEPIRSIHERTYTAEGDEVVRVSAVKSDDEITQDTGPSKVRAEETSGPDDDDDTCEEWERHEALHSDVTSQERSKDRLFEEEIELKWEKGGSGLVFYTDAQFWQEQEGDFDEQTTDDWDVDMSIYYGGNGDMDARQYLQMRMERRNGIAIYDDVLESASRRKKRRQKRRSRSESPPGPKRRGSFERHTKGVGRRLLESQGWREGDPLGLGSNSEGITDPVVADGQHPRLRKGFGYHGDKLLPSANEMLSRSNRGGGGNRINRPLTEAFRNVRSVEPMASHSYMFPQFDFNLFQEFKERTKSDRERAVPGDDGIVITTVYDEGLRIDRPECLLRSKHPAALKYMTVRTKPGNQEESGGVNNIPDADSLVDEGAMKPPRSKLVRPVHKILRADHEHPRKIAASSTSHFSSVPFVSGGLLE